MQEELKYAAQLIKEADCLLFLSGAGMGVDSGVGTFRGKNTSLCPLLKARGMDFFDVSNPRWFEDDPRIAYGYWRWVYDTYVTQSAPHQGYYMLQRWAEQKRFPAMSYTSNIDGHWLESGMPAERVVEIHGSVRYWQCCDNCPGSNIWSDPSFMGTFQIDPETHMPFEGQTLPVCTHCKSARVRPNVKMFQDTAWNPERTDEQKERWVQYVESIPQDKNIVLIECGAGTSVPTVRMTTERILSSRPGNSNVVRINLEQPEMVGTFQARPLKGVGMACGVLEGLKLIEQSF